MAMGSCLIETVARRCIDLMNLNQTSELNSNHTPSGCVIFFTDCKRPAIAPIHPIPSPKPQAIPLNP